MTLALLICDRLLRAVVDDHWSPTATCDRLDQWHAAFLNRYQQRSRRFFVGGFLRSKQMLKGHPKPALEQIRNRHVESDKRLSLSAVENRAKRVSRFFRIFADFYPSTQYQAIASTRWSGKQPPMDYGAIDRSSDRVAPVDEDIPKLEEDSVIRINGFEDRFLERKHCLGTEFEVGERLELAFRRDERCDFRAHLFWRFDIYTNSGDGSCKSDSGGGKFPVVRDRTYEAGGPDRIT